jgi:hypothetical protein
MEVLSVKWKALAASAIALVTFATGTFAAGAFNDVPRTHWAYKAIQKAVAAGVLEGYDGKFHGQKLINRYQMAVIIKRILDNVGRAGGPSAAGMSGEDVRNLEAMMIEFADELALLNVKVSTLEDSFVELRGEVDRMKMGAGVSSMSGGGGLANAFTGFVSVGLINTDDNAAAVAPAPANAAGSKTRYAGTADQTFFTIPQASIALDHEVSDGIGLHVQYDYGTDALNAVGGGVGLNEAYLFVDEIFGDVGGKVGGFAMPFQSWEINGPFRTSNDTITPSAKNTWFEGTRVVGLELTKTQDVDPADVKWHLGLFTGGDTVSAVGAGMVGAMSDAVGLGALAGSTTIDDSFGYYLDIESGDDPEKNWGWRLGLFDNGGDNGAVPAAPAVAPAGLANSQEIDGWQIGFWWKNDTFKVQFEYLSADSTTNVLGAGAAGQTNDITSWYILANYQMNEDSSLTVRYDDWENETNTVPATGIEGDGFTFAWNKKINDTSMFQFEWLSPDEQTITGTSSDVSDDLVQFRYKVWF